jgi:Holliday junction resolvase RusA-like endonuclease|tara:strand:+ start:185 stop:592 length:408 start_codon:yes stop_codon:yes gene_type:complete
MRKFIIIGKPISQKNSKRVGVRKGGKAYMYTPANVKSWHKEAFKQLTVQLEDWGNHYGDDLAPIPDKTDLDVTIVSYMDKGQSVDVDNLAGGPLDALQKAGVIANDYWIKRLCSIREKDWKNPRVEIEIEIYQGD